MADERIEHLYRVFSVYRRKLSPVAASADEDLETKKRLKATPLRELTERDVGAATAYCADVRSLKHFLPRMVEFAVRPGGGRGLVTHLLESARWRTWSDEERAAIEPFREALELK
jgi:hypothetical protein